MSHLTQTLLTTHTHKIQGYKRLLEHAHTANAAQLHALQAQVKMLRDGHGVSSMIRSEGGEPNLGLCICGGKKRKGYWSGYQDDFDTEEEDGTEGRGLMKALKGQKGVFSESEVRKAMRTLGREERMRL